MIRIERVYEPAEPSDGTWVLIDRLWPRGFSKEQLKFSEWLKEVAPSNELRKWFSHEPQKWEEFKKRYIAELDSNQEAWKPLVKIAQSGNTTLLYSSRDSEHNNAVVLKGYLESKLQKQVIVN